VSRERTGVSANAVVAELEAEVARLTGLIHDPFVAKRRAERIAVLEGAHEEAVAFLEDSGGCFCKYEDGCTCPAERIILRWRDKLQPRAALAAEPTEEPGCPCGITDPAHCSRCFTCRNIAAASCTEPTGEVTRHIECPEKCWRRRWRVSGNHSRYLPPECNTCDSTGWVDPHTGKSSGRSRCDICFPGFAHIYSQPTGGPKCEECGGSGVTYRWRAFTKRPPPCPSCTKGEG